MDNLIAGPGIDEMPCDPFRDLLAYWLNCKPEGDPPHKRCIDQFFDLIVAMALRRPPRRLGYRAAGRRRAG